MNTPEVGEGDRRDKLNIYLDCEIEKISQVLNEMPAQNQLSWEELNKIFVELV